MTERPNLTPLLRRTGFEKVAGAVQRVLDREKMDLELAQEFKPEGRVRIIGGPYAHLSPEGVVDHVRENGRVVVRFDKEFLRKKAPEIEQWGLPYCPDHLEIVESKKTDE